MFINLITVRQPLIYDCERTGSGSNSAETVVVCSIIIYSVGLLMMYVAMLNNQSPPLPKNIKIYSIEEHSWIVLNTSIR